MDYIWSIYGVKVRTNSVLAPCVHRPNFARRDLGTWGGGYWFLLSAVNLRFWRELVDVLAFIVEIYI